MILGLKLEIMTLPFWIEMEIMILPFVAWLKTQDKE